MGFCPQLMRSGVPRRTGEGGVGGEGREREGEYAHGGEAKETRSFRRKSAATTEALE